MLLTLQVGKLRLQEATRVSPQLGSERHIPFSKVPVSSPLPSVCDLEGTGPSTLFSLPSTPTHQGEPVVPYPSHATGPARRGGVCHSHWRALGLWESGSPPQSVALTSQAEAHS